MKSIGAQIDQLKKKDDEIDAAEGKVKKLRQQRAKLESTLLKSFDKDDIDGAKGKHGVASIKRRSFPSIKQRKKFLRYVIKNRAWDLFQNRISSTAYFDRLEEGESIPGVNVFEKISVSIRKRG